MIASAIWPNLVDLLGFRFVDYQADGFVSQADGGALDCQCPFIKWIITAPAVIIVCTALDAIRRFIACGLRNQGMCKCQIESNGFSSHLMDCKRRFPGPVQPLKTIGRFSASPAKAAATDEHRATVLAPDHSQHRWCEFSSKGEAGTLVFPI